jgi:hypothetical protein
MVSCLMARRFKRKAAEHEVDQVRWEREIQDKTKVLSFLESKNIVHA